MSDFNPDVLARRMVEAGEEWADKDAAASLLEETRKSLLAELMTGRDGSVNAREIEALASPTYRLHVTNMVTARRDANRARVRYDGIKVLAELRRSAESTKRAEMTLR